MNLTNKQAADRDSHFRRGLPLSVLSRFLQVTALLLAVSLSQAQTFTVLHTFRGKGDGVFPYFGLLRGKTGTLYGVTYHGGSFGYGEVFQINARGRESVLHSFWGGDGINPAAELIQDGAGNLYGAANEGGTPGERNCLYGCGTVFKLDVTGKLTVLHAFTGGADGGAPRGLAEDGNGNLFGVTDIGGDKNCSCGVVFKIDRDGKETVLHAFTGAPDGNQPSGRLIRDAAGNFYGTTFVGGTSNNGTIFKLDASGKETVIYSFAGSAAGNSPNAPLVLDAEGNFYGTTLGGGDSSCNCGVVFKLDRMGKETVLHNFTGNPDGYLPSAGLVRDRLGNLYGTTENGGGCQNSGVGCGTVFKVDAHGNETVLYRFTGGTDGADPLWGSLVVDKAGKLYGTTFQGGDLSCGRGGNGCGVVFKITP